MAAWLPGATLLAGAVQRAPGAVGWWGQTGGGGGGCRGGRGGGGHWGTASIGAGDACILWRYHLNACTVHVLVHVRVCTVLSSKYYCSVNYLYNTLYNMWREKVPENRKDRVQILQGSEFNAIHSMSPLYYSIYEPPLPLNTVSKPHLNTHPLWIPSLNLISTPTPFEYHFSAPTP